ncbi:hypothetical protein ACFE04_003838 [Oxalis oulophora]
MEAEEEEEATSPFWLKPNINPHLPPPPPIYVVVLLNGLLLVFLLFLIFIYVYVFIVSTLVSLTTSQIFTSLFSLKKNWESLNIVILLFAIICGCLTAFWPGSDDNRDHDHYRNNEYATYDFPTPNVPRRPSSSDPHPRQESPSAHHGRLKLSQALLLLAPRDPLPSAQGDLRKPAPPYNQPSAPPHNQPSSSSNNEPSAPPYKRPSTPASPDRYNVPSTPPYSPPPAPAYNLYLQLQPPDLPEYYSKKRRGKALASSYRKKNKPQKDPNPNLPSSSFCPPSLPVYNKLDSKKVKTNKFPRPPRPPPPETRESKFKAPQRPTTVNTPLPLLHEAHASKTKAQQRPIMVEKSLPQSEARASTSKAEKGLISYSYIGSQSNINKQGRR